MPVVEFTDNVQNLSTDQGFQFKFHCERCGDGYMSSYVPNVLGLAAGLLRGAGSVFGGLLGRASAGTYEVQRAVGGPQHDSAFQKAVEEIRPLFRKCRRCGNWLCQTVCWNEAKNMCKPCAPVAQEEEEAIRAEHVRTQVVNDLFLEENKRMSEKGKEVAAKCPACGVATLGKKFCPGCGQKLAAAESVCGQCGTRLTPGAKFCGDCGAQSGG